MNTPTVLIADNDRAVSSLLTDVLVRAGLRVRHAYDGEEARTMAQAGGCKVLVCDLDMPKLSGLEVLEALADSAAPPFALVISGYLDSGVMARLGALPYVRGVLRKPFDLLRFAETVQQLVRGAGERASGADVVVAPRVGSAEQ